MKDKVEGIKVVDEVSDKNLFEGFFKVGHIDIKETDLETLFDWKTKVWDNCKHRKEKDTKDGVLYFCSLVKKNCIFKNCPKK